jgi:large subunit ribosomal protein L23
MKNVYDVIRRPLFTEKGSNLKESENKILIEVAMDSNKIEIKKAVEELFKVKVDKIATIKAHGKMKRYGKFTGKTSERKKALITLKEGEKLDFIEGA